MPAPAQTPSPSIGRLALRIFSALALVILSPLLLIAGCQSRMIYHPRQYPPGYAETWTASGGRIIDYSTTQGRQRAFLQGNLDRPRNLWLAAFGNASVALENSQWIAAHAPPEDAWVLFDFPGYGDSDGAASPDAVLESWRALLPAVRDELAFPEDPSRLRVFGHSLGAAASLIAASEFEIQRGVLLSPFTSTMDMAQVLLGLPVGFLVTHRYDNLARLQEIADRGPGQLIVIHGVADSIIPISMSRRIAAEHPRHIELLDVANADHNDLQAHHATVVAKALHRAGD
jgi:uncharacterized protein